MSVFKRTRRWRAEAARRRNQWLWGSALLSVFVVGFYTEAFPDGFYLDATVVRYGVADLVTASGIGRAPFKSFAGLREHLETEVGGTDPMFVIPTEKPPLQVWARWTGHWRVRRALDEFRAAAEQRGR